MTSSERPSMEDNEDEEMTRLTISSIQAREEEIERRKMAVREKVELQLGRAEEQTKRLHHIWEELEELTDPMRKEVGVLRKKVDMTNRELKSLGQSCQKKGAKIDMERLGFFKYVSGRVGKREGNKMRVTNYKRKNFWDPLQEKEYKDALEAFNVKNKEKSQLVATLMEMLAESENLRMRKLEELSKNIHRQTPSLEHYFDVPVPLYDVILHN